MFFCDESYIIRNMVVRIKKPVIPGETPRSPGIQGDFISSSIQLDLKFASRIKSGMTKKYFQ